MDVIEDNWKYFEKVDRIMTKRGYQVILVKNSGTENETRCYMQTNLEKSNKIGIEVTYDKKFKFIYSNKDMLGMLDSGWMSPINKKEFFEKRLKMFNRSVLLLRLEYKDN
jgi:hypothetical protein